MISRHQQTYADLVNDFVGGNYRIFENQDNIAPGSPLAAANTPATIDSATPDFRMRLGLANNQTSLSGWQEQTGSGEESWRRISGSADGEVLAAVASDFSRSGADILAISTDAGVTWSYSSCGDSMADYIADVVVSGDGSTMAILCGVDDTGSSGGYFIYIDIVDTLTGSTIESQLAAIADMDYFYLSRLVGSSDLSHLAVQSIYSDQPALSLSADSGQSWDQMNMYNTIYNSDCVGGAYLSDYLVSAIAMSGDASTLLVAFNADTPSVNGVLTFDLSDNNYTNNYTCEEFDNSILALDISDDASTWVAVDANADLLQDGEIIRTIDYSGTITFALVTLSGDGTVAAFSISSAYGYAFTSYTEFNDQDLSGDLGVTAFADMTISSDGSRAAAAVFDGFDTSGGVNYIWTYEIEELSPVLQYAEKTAGTCSAQNTGWTDVSGATDIKWKTNPNVASGASISGTANDPPALSGFPYVYQSYASSAGGVTVSGLEPSNSGLWDFSLTVDSSVADDTSFCLRLAQDNGDNTTTPFATYNSYPEIQVVAAAFTVTSITPDNGPVAGGTDVTITGTNFNMADGARIVQVAAGRYHSLALDDQGNVYAWGDNSYSQLGDGTVGSSDVPILISDGAIVGSALTAGVKISQVATGDQHSLAVDDQGNVYAWGYALLGDDTGGGSDVPILISGGVIASSALTAGVKIVQVSAGFMYSLALDDQGDVYAWGSSNYGQIGDGTMSYNILPIKISDGVIAGSALTAGVEIVQIATSSAATDSMHSLAVDDQGNVYAWGNNAYGQLGINSDAGPSTCSAGAACSMLPIKISGGAIATSALTAGVNIVQVAAGEAHSLALDDQGNVYTWGDNSNGQLGNNSTYQSLVPIKISGGVIATSALTAGVKISQVATGEQHSFAIDDQGDVYAWGYNISGQLGDSTVGNSYVPILISDGAVASSALTAGVNIVQVAAGEAHSLALDDQGNVYAWGDNYYGQIGDITVNWSAVPINTDFSNFDSSPPTVIFDAGGAPAPCTNVVVVNSTTITCTTSAHAVALVDVAVTIGGSTATLPNSFQYYDVPSAPTITSITPNYGLETGGTNVTITGTDFRLSPPMVDGISAFESYSCGIYDGKAYCWGYNNRGQLGDGSTDDSPVPVAVDTTGVLGGKTVTAIADGASSSHTCAIADGKAYCWGRNNRGQLGDGSTNDSLVPIAVDTTGVLGGKTVTAITAGRLYTCAVADGQAYCWGANDSGGLGDDSTDQSLVPVAVDTTGVLGGKTVTDITAGDNNTCAIADGKAYCWGNNWSGQLGDGSTDNSLIPVAVDTTGVLGGKTVTAITASSNNTCAIADGKAYCWGDNVYGGLGDGSTNQRLFPVAVDTTGVLGGKTVTSIDTDYLFTCAVADAQAYCWGYNSNGQLGDGSTNQSLIPVAVDTTGVLGGKTVTAIAVGYNHTCAIADGRTYCWGDNASGELGDDSTDQSLVSVDVDISGLPLSPPTVIFDVDGTPATCTNVVLVNSTTITCTTSAHAPGLVSVTVIIDSDVATLPAVCSDELSYGGPGGNGGTDCNGRLDNGETIGSDRANVESGFLYEEIYINLILDSSLVEIGNGVNPSPGGTFASGANTLTTSTNNPWGYLLSISTNQPSTNPNASDLKHLSLSEYVAGTANTCSWTPSGTPGTPGSFGNTGSSLVNNTWGFTLDLTNLGAERLCRVPNSGSPLTIKQTIAADELGDPTNVFFGARVNLSKPSGKYQTTVVYTVVAGT
ncbi:IPT/TIG domain-containing protein [Candidatus Saccharibacteria bacterium]|nr:IPT/TIG domain-containing protein [Candidatus Saccharibacteria bacterium]